MAAGSCGRVWLLSMILFAVPNVTHLTQRGGLGPPGGPPPPSPPSCHIPFEESGLAVRSAIQCVWDPGPPSKTPSNYTLHWQSADSRQQSVRGSNTSAAIQYDLVYSDSELSVWVEAESQHGVAYSPKSVFNTASIMKPVTPTITKHDVEPLEIYWESKCSKLGLSEDQCQVRHRTAEAEGWSEVEEGHQGLYLLEEVLPYSWYEFQVRCACLGSLLSDWSQVYAAESPGAAPVGMLDIWSDCQSSAQSFGCVLMWKMPLRWQAGGEILRYVLTLSLRNGTQTVVNVSTTDQLTPCDTKLCHFTGALTDVTAVNVSAYTAHGATQPARLHIPLSAQENRGDPLQLKINPKRIVVSWSAPTGYRNNQSEYVVQYKQAGLPQTNGFDWIRLQKSQMSANITGQFEKYIPYQVALFSVSPDGSSHHLSSAVGYVAQGIPPQVARFELGIVSAHSVMVTWEPVPLPQRRGVIVCYQIGVDSQRVYNVSEPQGDERGVFLLEHLKPGQDYEVWIRAVTEAGPGPTSTMTFKAEGFDYNILFLLVAFIPFISFFLIRKFSWVIKKSIVKVPDPSNSHVFQKMNHQINTIFICIPVEESDPVLSHLEIVTSRIEDWAGSGNIAPREQCYSRMADSDDEDREVFPSDYETHFLPTAMDIMSLM